MSSDDAVRRNSDTALPRRFRRPSIGHIHQSSKDDLHISQKSLTSRHRAAAASSRWCNQAPRQPSDGHLDDQRPPIGDDSDDGESPFKVLKDSKQFMFDFDKPETAAIEQHGIPQRSETSAMAYLKPNERIGHNMCRKGKVVNCLDNAPEVTPAARVDHKGCLENRDSPSSVKSCAEVSSCSDYSLAAGLLTDTTKCAPNHAQQGEQNEDRVPRRRRMERRMSCPNVPLAKAALGVADSSQKGSSSANQERPYSGDGAPRRRFAKQRSCNDMRLAKVDLAAGSPKRTSGHDQRGSSSEERVPQRRMERRMSCPNVPLAKAALAVADSSQKGSFSPNQERQRRNSEDSTSRKGIPRRRSSTKSTLKLLEKLGEVGDEDLLKVRGEWNRDNFKVDDILPPPSRTHLGDKSSMMENDVDAFLDGLIFMAPNSEDSVRALMGQLGRRYSLPRRPSMKMDLQVVE
jgi:hypothetical protein